MEQSETAREQQETFARQLETRLLEHSESAREPLEAAARKLETLPLERLELIERTVASVDTSSQLTREQLTEDSRSVAESAQCVLDELVERASGELGQVLLEVGAS